MPICDNCTTTKGRIRRIELGGGSGMYLCDPCLRKEIVWRKLKNKELKKRYHGKPPAGILFRTKYKF